MQKRKLSIFYPKPTNIIPLKSPSQEPWLLEPEDLRSQVQRRFSTLAPGDSKIMCKRLLTGLAKAGVHVGSSLFMLGIPATRFDDLTPSDMGKLLRYTRINSPAAVKALNGLLTDFLYVKKEPAVAAPSFDEAA